MEPRDEFVHDYPRPLTAEWKENWYFNFIDRERRAWGVNHISLMRQNNKGRFSAMHVVDGEMLLYSNVIDIPDDLPELGDGKLKFEFLEPFQKFRVTFTGPRHQLVLDYLARFPVFDYASGRADKSGRRRELVINHYEQALFAKGTLTKAGETRALDCLGHRDHSWGYRDENKVGAWNWIAVQFPALTVNMSLVSLGDKQLPSGFISSAEGNIRMKYVTVSGTTFKNNCPVGSRFVGVDEKGRTWTLTSNKFSSLYLPMKEKGRGAVVHENFSDFLLEESGAQGVGIDEYLVNQGLTVSKNQNTV
jgi:hypothetical protein